MGHIGRNAPCPCGSGKKYKKCCLGEPQAPAGDPHDLPPATASNSQSSGPHTSPRAQARALHSLSGLLRTIWSHGAELHHDLAERSFSTPLADMAEAYGYDYDELDEAATYLLVALTLFAPPLCATQVLMRSELDARLPRAARHLYRSLCATPLQAWELGGQREGVTRGRPLAGTGERPWRPLSAVLGYDPPEPSACYVGWPVVFEGCLVLFGTVAVDEEGCEWIVEAAAASEAEDDGALWRAVHESLVAAALEPEYDLEDDDTHWYDAPVARRVDTATLRRWTLARAEWHEGGSLRLLAARARGATDLVPLLGRLRHIRAGLLPPVERARDPAGTELDALLPLVELLAHFGVAADGSMDAPRLRRLERAPLRLLRLDDELLRRTGLDEHTPIGALASWCAERPDGPERRGLEEALERVRTEQRWLATFEASGETWLREMAAAVYNALMTGLDELCDAALRAAPLPDLGLPKAVLTRLRKAYEALSRPAPTTLGDLPRRVADLWRMQGIGSATVSALVEAVLAFLGEWRYRRAGVAPERLDPLGEPAHAVKEELRGGLEELAALLG